MAPSRLFTRHVPGTKAEIDLLLNEQDLFYFMYLFFLVHSFFRRQAARSVKELPAWVMNE